MAEHPTPAINGTKRTGPWKVRGTGPRYADHFIHALCATAGQRDQLIALATEWEAPGIYALVANDEVYVGETGNLIQRICYHEVSFERGLLVRRSAHSGHALFEDCRTYLEARLLAELREDGVPLRNSLFRTVREPEEGMEALHLSVLSVVRLLLALPTPRPPLDGTSAGLYDLSHRILEWVRREKPETFTHRELHRALEHFVNRAGDLNPPLDVLISKGWLRRLETPKNPKGGRPSYRFRPAQELLAPPDVAFPEPYRDLRAG